MFEDAEQIAYFFERVQGELERGTVLVRGFAILVNHFHLLVRWLDGELGDLMCRLLAPYVRHFNRSRSREGQLLSRPYGATRIDGEWHLRTAQSYVDANPAGHRVVTDARTYPHCSAYWQYQGLLPDIIDRREMESALGVEYGDRAEWARAYDREYGRDIGTEEFELLELRDEQRLREKAAKWDLYARSSSEMRDWLRRRGAQQDGGLRTLPFTTERRLRAAVADLRMTRGAAVLRSGKRRVELWELALTGLLVSACGYDRARAGRTLRISARGVGKRLEHYERLLREPEFRERVTAVLVAACPWLK